MTLIATEKDRCACREIKNAAASMCRTCEALRDQFAIAALPETARQFSVTPKEHHEIALRLGYSGTLPGLIAICAYELADAMLKARAPKQGEVKA